MDISFNTFFLTLFIPREFAQFRTSIAVGIFLIALTCKSSTLKYLLFCLSALMHLTVCSLLLVYSISYIIAWIKNKFLKYTVVLIISILLLFVGMNIEIFSFIDGRVSLYINYDKVGYGLPIDDYTGLISFCCLFVVCLICGKKLYSDFNYNLMMIIHFFSIVNYVAFFNYAIFATRISSVMLSLYPFLFIYCLTNKNKEQQITIKKTLFILVPYAILLLFRPGSYRIINAIGL